MFIWFHYTFTCSILNEALACQGAHICRKRQKTMALTCTHPVCYSGFLEPSAQNWYPQVFILRTGNSTLVLMGTDLFLFEVGKLKNSSNFPPTIFIHTPIYPTSTVSIIRGSAPFTAGYSSKWGHCVIGKRLLCSNPKICPRYSFSFLKQPYCCCLANEGTIT